jgi:hypothetical protein
MNENERGYTPPEKSKKLTTQDILKLISQEKKVHNMDMSDVRLNGENLSGVSFRGCDIRGINLSPKQAESEHSLEKPTDITNTDWIDTVVATASGYTSFVAVMADGAKFGFEMTLADRNEMIATIKEKLNRGPQESECGGYFNFDGREGVFTNTAWKNIDFGGGTNYKADFSGARLVAAFFDRCNLQQIDLSQTSLEWIGIKVESVLQVKGMKIAEDQAEIIAEGITIINSEMQKDFSALKLAIGSSGALEEFFGIEIV